MIRDTALPPHWLGHFCGDCRRFKKSWVTSEGIREENFCVKWLKEVKIDRRACEYFLSRKVGRKKIFVQYAHLGETAESTLEADGSKGAHLPQISEREESIFKTSMIVRSSKGVERKCMSITEVESAVKSSLEEGNKFSIAFDRDDGQAHRVAIELGKRFSKVSSVESASSGIREITFVERQTRKRSWLV